MLATALRLIDADGVDALSMRRLGRALDRDPMRLYRFAASKDELLDGIVELVLGELEVPSRTPRSLVRRAAAHRAPLPGHRARHPHVVPLLVTRPARHPAGVCARSAPCARWRRCSSCSSVAGFDARGALHAYRLYMGFLQGHVLNELQERVYDPEETDDLLRLGLTVAAPRSSPGSAPSPPSWPSSTASRSSTKASTSSSTASAANSNTDDGPDLHRQFVDGSGLDANYVCRRA